MSYFLVVELYDEWQIQPVNIQRVKIMSLQKLTEREQGGKGIRGSSGVRDGGRFVGTVSMEYTNYVLLH